MAVNVALMSILRRYLKETDRKCDSLADIAAVLDVDSTALSRYRSNKRHLTEAKARVWAEQLLPGQSERWDDLTAELLGTQPTQAESLREARAWIRGLGAKGKLLIVEFREPPAISAEGGHNDLAVDVALSVANGLNYALIFPFPWNIQDHVEVPGRLRSYIERVRDSILKTVITVAEEMADHFHSNLPTNPSEIDKKKLVEEINHSISRLKVYYFPDSHKESSCPGLGYRTFLVDGFDQKDGEWAPVSPEVWQWISTEKGERLVRKLVSEDELEIARARYYPIVQFFEEKKTLPDQPGLDEFVNTDPIALALSRGKSDVLNDDGWKVFDLRTDAKLTGEALWKKVVGDNNV
jgi:hypothetical protein